MKTSKMLLISAEICALILLALLLYMSASSHDFDYTRVVFGVMFAVVAVVTQSIQQDIPWLTKNDAKKTLVDNNDEMQRLIDEAQSICRKQQAIINDAIKMLNDAQ